MGPHLRLKPGDETEDTRLLVHSRATILQHRWLTFLIFTISIPIVPRHRTDRCLECVCCSGTLSPSLSQSTTQGLVRTGKKTRRSFLRLNVSLLRNVRDIDIMLDSISARIRRHYGLVCAVKRAVCRQQPMWLIHPRGENPRCNIRTHSHTFQGASWRLTNISCLRILTATGLMHAHARRASHR